MKYFISHSLLHEMTEGHLPRKREIEKFLANLIQNNNHLMTCVISLYQLVATTGKNTDIILNQLDIVLDAVVPVSFANLKSSRSFQQQYDLTDMQAVEVILALEHGAVLLENNHSLKNIKSLAVTGY